MWGLSDLKVWISLRNVTAKFRAAQNLWEP
jgi:hypothetical protein